MINLTQPFFDQKVKQEFITAIKNHDFDGNIYIKRFIDELGATYGLPYGLCVNSGTSALIISLATAGVKRGDSVMVPVYTCKAILDAIYLLGAKPILVDVYCDYKKMDFNLDEEAASKKLTADIKSIILPYAFGKVHTYHDLWKTGIPIIEDVTLSLGAELKKTRQGKRIVVASLHSSKVISAFEGGVILTDDYDIYQKLLKLVDIITVNKHERTMPAEKIKYEMNYSFRPSELNFLYGYLQLKRLKKFIAKRQKIAKAYIERLDKSKYDLPVFEKATVYFRFIVGLKRFDVVSVLGYLSRHGIEAGRGIYPLLSDYFHDKQKFINAETAVNKSLSIPLHLGIKDKEINKIITLLNLYEE